MAWITPKTDWVETDRCTYEDMNRIAGNINYLCGTSLKANYTQDNVVTLHQWRQLVQALKTFAAQLEFETEDEPTEDATALNFNVVEGLTLDLCNWKNMLDKQAVAIAYVGDDLYVGDNEQWLRKGT